MQCEGCGNAGAYRVRSSRYGEECDACGRLSGIGFADVYFVRPYFDQHIAHPEQSPNGNFIRSRGHKAELMREIGLTEAGDKRHGSRQRF